MVREVSNNIRDKKDGEGQTISLRFSPGKRETFKVEWGLIEEDGIKN